MSAEAATLDGPTEAWSDATTAGQLSVVGVGHLPPQAFMIIVFLVARLQLLCTEPWQLGILEVPKGCVSGMVGGMMVGGVMGLRTSSHYAGGLALGLCCSAILACSIGRVTQVQLFNGIALAIVSVVALPWAKRKRLAIAISVFAVFMQCIFSLGLANQFHIKGVVPPVLKGLLTPMFVTVYVTLAQHALIAMWKRWATKEMDPDAFGAMAAYVVQTSESIRFVGLLTALQAEDQQSLWKEAVVNLLTSMVGDTLWRCQALASLISVLRGKPLKEVDHLTDTFLRCYFIFGYTPLAFSIPPLCVGAVMGLSWARKWDLVILWACAFAAEIFSDFMVVVIQGWLHGWVAPCEMLKRLRGGAAHLPLSAAIRLRRVVPSEGVDCAVVPYPGSEADPSNGTGALEEGAAGAKDQEEVSSVDDMGLKCCGWQLANTTLVLRLFVAWYGCLNMDRAFAGVFGPCGWNLPDWMCEGT